ncbi:MAG: hypothetical protein MJA28_02170 [Gammaproteobacteria bacterium]|nr:hypothetical protein [Gammaproteobacteria bacterium]
MIRVLLMCGLCLVALSACLDNVEVEPEEEVGQTLCLADYQACVDPVFHASINGRAGPLTCSASGCHDINAGSGGGFKIFPNPGDDQAKLLANFTSARAFANMSTPPQSKLLLEPLNGISAISGTHTGGDIFPNENDGCYQAILSWIATRVNEETADSCGRCTVPTISACGF